MPSKERGKKDEPVTVVEQVDKNLAHLGQIPHLFEHTALTRLTLSHNKLTVVPPNIADLTNLEVSEKEREELLKVLTLWNNQIEELPTSISELPHLKILNVGMNRLSILPRGFGSFAALEILDLTYNNLSERSLPGNFFFMKTLRALYLSDNDFEYLPGDVENLSNLQILALRDNDLLSIPPEIGRLRKLRELHIQGNRLTSLPPEVGELDLAGARSVFRLEHNPFGPPIQTAFEEGGAPAVIDLLRSENYKEVGSGGTVPPKRNKDKKVSRATTKQLC